MILNLENITKSFGAENVLNNISFSLPEKTTLSILGRSGCGKTTLLKIIAGLIEPGSGNIVFNGENINKRPAQLRDIVYLYQEPLLFPHLNVYENIAFGLRLRKKEPAFINNSVDEMISALELTGQEKKMPQQLSGGQKQRVAFGRAVIVKPGILLLDEPFGNLDTETRNIMQQLFLRIAGTYHITSLFVTHDLKEALLMGNSFSFMKEGKLKLFESRQHFINDADTGIKNEIEFWKGI